MCHWSFDEDSEMHFSYLMIYVELYYRSCDSNRNFDLIKSSFVRNKVSILRILLNKDIR